MRNLFYLLLFLLPVSALSQADTDEQPKSLETRIKKLEKIKNKIKISGVEQTFLFIPKVKFNFSKPDKITIPRKIKEGDFFQIEVTDLNLNRYIVQLETDDTIYSQPLSFPTFGTLDLSSLSSLVAKLPQISLTKSADQPILNKALSDLFKFNFQSDSPLNKNFLDINALVIDGSKLIDLEMAEAKKVKDTRKLIEAMIKKTTVNIEKYLKELKIANDAIEEKKYTYMAYRIQRKTNDIPNIDSPDIKKDLQDFDEYRSTLKGLKETISLDIKNLETFIDTDAVKVLLAQTVNIDLKEKVEKVQKALSTSSTQTAKAISIISTDNIEKQLIAVLNLYKENTYTSLPIQFHGEQAKVSIKFIPKDSSSNLQTYILPEIRFPQRKWYWSIGPSMYYSPKMENERVGIESDSSTQFKLLEESPLEGELGTAILLRGGTKIMNSMIGIHVAAGTGLSLAEEIRPRMLLGGGITIGQKHSLAIDFGAVGGYTNAISSSADYNTPYIEKPDVLINTFQFKFFWSVGYAFRF